MNSLLRGRAEKKGRNGMINERGLEGKGGAEGERGEETQGERGRGRKRWTVRENDRT